MDRDYIKLCAEMAYNDVLIEATLSEEYDILNEGAIIDKVKKLFESFITFIKRLWDKFIAFFNQKVKEFKEKFKELKSKQEEKKKEAKSESASMYDQLMEMLLVEEADDIETSCCPGNVDDIKPENAISELTRLKDEMFKEIEWCQKNEIKSHDIANKDYIVNKYTIAGAESFKDMIDDIKTARWWTDDGQFEMEMLCSHKEKATEKQIDDSISKLFQKIDIVKNIDSVFKSTQQAAIKEMDSLDSNHRDINDNAYYHIKACLQIIYSACEASLVGSAHAITSMQKMIMDGQKTINRLNSRTYKPNF